MFIGWIRKNTFYDDLDKLSKLITIDLNLVRHTFEENEGLVFGAYEGQDMIAIVTAFSFSNSILINNFYYLKDTPVDVLKRLIKILLNNIYENEKSILVMANIKEQKMFEQLKFKKYANFKKAVHSGSAVAFNFSNTTAKSISNPNYLPRIKKLDSEAFNEDRYDYITRIVSKQSSLVLSTDFGYQHSYAINNNIVKISPWIMVDEAFSDAEKLIRGVLYHRGLKTVVAFVPQNIKEIIDLYESYKFEFVDDFILMYLNKKPNISLASIYGY